MPTRLAPPLTVLLLVAVPVPAAGDAIVVSRAMTASTVAEIFVEADAVRVELEIGARDLEAFVNVLPDEVVEHVRGESSPFATRLSRFHEEDLVLRADGGDPLPARVLEMVARRRVPRDTVTGEPLAVAEEDGEPVVFVSLEYGPIERPATLHLSRRRGDPGSVGADVGFVLYHRGVPVTDFRYLSGEEVLDLDWDDPWYSRFRNRNLRRQYDAPLSVFLYVEPLEVRVEVIARPGDLQRWVDLGLEGTETIPAADQPELLRRVGELLAGRMALTVDGAVARPALDRIHFLRRTLRTSTVIDPPEELQLVSATLGAIFVMPTVTLPERATLIWSLFDGRIEQVPAASVDEAGPLPQTLTVDDPVLRWENFLTDPTIPTFAVVAAPPSALRTVLPWLGALFGLLFVGAAFRARGRPARARIGALLLLGLCVVSFVAAWTTAPAPGERRSVVAGLLHNVYRAFDYRGESETYDVLARSVAGDLLTRTYLEMRRGLVLENQGGARVKVKEVELTDAEIKESDDGAGFVARCSWNVAGSVGHWGHVHQRVNRYQAFLSVAPAEGSWKITDLTLLLEERL